MSTAPDLVQSPFEPLNYTSYNQSTVSLTMNLSLLKPQLSTLSQYYVMSYNDEELHGLLSYATGLVGDPFRDNQHLGVVIQSLYLTDLIDVTERVVAGDDFDNHPLCRRALYTWVPMWSKFDHR